MRRSEIRLYSLGAEGHYGDKPLHQRQKEGLNLGGVTMITTLGQFKFLYPLLLTLLTTAQAYAGTATIGPEGIDRLNQLLVAMKPVKNLVCLIKAKHQRVDQKFFAGRKINESLQLHLFSKGPWLGLQEMQFTFLVSDLMECLWSLRAHRLECKLSFCG